MSEFNKRVLIAIAGLSTSGKSTIAQEVAKQLGIKSQDVDEIRKETHPVWPHISPATAHLPYAVAENLALRASHREAQYRAGRILDSGRPALIVQTLRTPHAHEIIKSLAKEHQASLIVVRLDVPYEVALSRVRSRNRMEDFVWNEEQLRCQFEGYTPYPKPDLYIDTSYFSPKNTAEFAVSRIRAIYADTARVAA